MTAANRFDPSDREAFWADVAAGYARLRADPDAWQKYREEVALWESGSLDGLEHEPTYFTPAELEQLLAEIPQ